MERQFLAAFEYTETKSSIALVPNQVPLSGKGNAVFTADKKDLDLMMTIKAKVKEDVFINTGIKVDVTILGLIELEVAPLEG